jgi:PAS domain S-box-containing protein
MTERTRILVLILIMAIGLFLVTGITVGILYRVAFREGKARLVETAKSQARLIEAVARYDVIHSTDYPGGPEAATLRQIEDAHLEDKGLGETGEFTLARREGDLIVFLLEHRHEKIGRLQPVPFDSELAEPMRRALSGRSGTVVGLDYRGATVLAAHEPVEVLDMGIVAKIDLEEIQAPFLRAGLAAVGISLLVVVGGAALLVRVSNPLVEELQERSLMLEDTVAALEDSEERYRTTFELAAVGIAHVSQKGRFIGLNRRFCEIVGYPHEEIAVLTFQEITHTEDLDLDLENVRRMLAGEIDTYSVEKRYIRKDSSVVWVNLTVSLVRDGSGNPEHFIAVIEDITRRKEAEFAVKRSLEEKEVLLREVHHRVKNNMQVISSLLNLQARSIEDPRLAKMFQESQSRVRAMALIHEILYDSEDLSEISLDLYVSRLAKSLIRMFGADPDVICLEVDAGDVAVSIDDIVPCGLVISELLTNSLKYAFPDGREGEIRIHAMLTEDNEILLVVCDDGVGMPSEMDLRRTGTTGLGLVVGLVEKQLGGRLTLDGSHGTCFTIVIPNKEPSQI